MLDPNQNTVISNIWSLNSMEVNDVFMLESLSVCARPSVRPSVCLSVCPSVCLSVFSLLTYVMYTKCIILYTNVRAYAQPHTESA